MASGFGYVQGVTNKSYSIIVSDSIDYEISFWFKQPNTEASFELSVNCFDCNLQREIRPISILSGAQNNVFLPGNEKICSLPNKWNFFHCILYNKYQPVVNDAQPITSHAAGRNLIMRNGTQKIFVNLINVNNCLLVWDFKIKPASTPFSTGFIQSNGLVEIWRKNNKKDLTELQIDTLAKEFLFTDDTATSVINL